MAAMDALKAFWILGVFLSTFFWLPTHLFAGRPNSPGVIRIAGNWARTVLCVTILVFLLSSLRVLGAITVVLLFLGTMAVSWFRKRAGRPRRLLTNLQAATVSIMCQVESRSLGLFLPRRRSPTSARLPWGLRVTPWLKVLEGRELLGACFVVVLGITVVLRTEHALRELRFDQPEQYSALLRARELMFNTHPAGRPFVFPAVIATTSLLSSTDPTQVTRFLTPAIGLFVVLATGLLIQVCARAGVACVAAIYCLGAAVLPTARSQTGVAISATEKIESVFSVSSPATLEARPEFALGLLFLLLALVFLADWYRNSRGWDSLLDFACCLLLTGIVSQPLLVVLMMAAGVLLLRPMAGLFAFAMLGYGLVACATLSTGITIPEEMLTSLPVAAAILVGCILAFIEAKLVAIASRRAETVLLAACLCAAVICLRPQRSLGRCLEYEAAARATQEIAYRFPRQTWVVAAPVEQLAETFGLGGHEDLAGFVEKYGSQVSSPEFRFQDTREDLFIYVEKKPFQIFPREPETVSFSVLADPTYRNYRSPGGRASLEAAAQQLCESYRQYHSNIDVFFENEVLRIYHIHQQQVLDTKERTVRAS